MLTRRVISCAKLLDFEERKSKTLKTERKTLKPCISLEPKVFFSYDNDIGDIPRSVAIDRKLKQ